jgi:hypothetical protein
MLRATAKTDDGATLVLIGLSFANLDRLRREAGDGFIKITGAEMDIGRIDILITAAETEAALLQLFAGRIGANTKFSIDEKLKS